MVEDFPEENEALVVQTEGSSSCPVIRMAMYYHDGDRYALAGFWGASYSRPGGHPNPLQSVYVYTTTEVVADSLSCCLGDDQHRAFGVSVDPGVYDLTVGGVAPTWVRELSYDGGTLLRLVLR